MQRRLATLAGSIFFLLLCGLVSAGSFVNGKLISGDTPCSSDNRPKGSYEKSHTAGIVGGSSNLDADLSCQGGGGHFGGHTTLENDLAAYFTLESDASDITENKSAGTMFHTVSHVAGKHDNCASFPDDGTTARYSWSPEMTFSGGDDGELSVSMWLYMPSSEWTPFETKYILSSSDDSHHQLLVTSQRPATAGTTHTDSMTFDAWHHLVVCWPGANFTVGGYIVIDGDWAGRETFDNESALSISDFGATYWHVAADTYNGRIDEMGFWNRKLTESEVNDLYNSGSGLFY